MCQSDHEFEVSIVREILFEANGELEFGIVDECSNGHLLNIFGSIASFSFEIIIDSTELSSSTR